MIEQEITLLTNGRISFQKCGNGLQFGYSKNRGVYSIKVKTSGEWNGLTIRAFWHIPDIKEPITSLLVDNVIRVPALVTSYKGEGRIVFEGSDGVKTVTSADIRYYVNKNSGTCDGTIPEPGTPAWQELVGTVKKYSDTAVEAKESAKKSADEAKQALEDTKDVKSQAIEEINSSKTAVIEEIENKKNLSIEEINSVKEDAKGELETLCDSTRDFANQAKEAADRAKASELAAKDSELKSKESERLASEYKNSANESANAALKSEENASISESNATEAANRALISENNAKLSETASDNSSKKAFDSETKAKASEINSSNNAVNAEHSAINAAASADAAKGSEDKAKTSEIISTANTAEVAKNLETVRDIKAEIDILDANVSANAASSNENANNARISAEAAKQSETNAALSEASALESKNASAENAAKSQNNASNAKNSADSAKESETKAQEYSNLSQSNANASSESASNAKASEGASKKNADDSAATLQELKDGIASGNFKGEKGDKGDPGPAGKDAPQIDDTTVNDSAPWSSKHIVDVLCPPMEETGNPVTCYPVESYPLGVTASWEPTQEGSGDPSPDNVRPIKGRDSVTVERCGKNLLKLNERIIDKETVILKENDLVFLSKCFHGKDVTLTFACDTKDIVFSDTAEKWRKRIGYECHGFLDDGTEVWSLQCWLTDGQDNLTRNGKHKKTVTLKMPNIVKGTINFYAQNIKSGTFTAYDFGIYAGGTLPDNLAQYNGVSVPLAFPSTIYGGTVDAVSGESSRTWRTITLTGEESSHIYSTIFYLDFNKDSSFVAEEPVDLATGKSSHYRYTTYANDSVGVTLDGYSVVYSSNGKYPISDEGLREWKSYLAAQYAAGTPVQIAYKLATPTPFTATGAQPISSLSGVNTLMTDANNVTVTGRADPIKRITDLEDAVASMTNT